MLRRPPGSTRTDSPFPYAPTVRSGRGPHSGAQEPAAAAAVEKEDLRRIAVRRELSRIARLELGDDAIGEEAAVARKAGKEVGALRQAGFVGEIDADRKSTRLNSSH